MFHSRAVGENLLKQLTIAALSTMAIVACNKSSEPKVVDSLRKAKRNTARVLVTKVNQKATLFAVRRGSLPKSLDELVDAGLTKSDDLADPWGTALWLTRSDNSFTTCSAGPDREKDTSDDICQSERR